MNEISIKGEVDVSCIGFALILFTSVTLQSFDGDNLVFFPFKSTSERIFVGTVNWEKATLEVATSPDSSVLTID